MSRWLTYSNFYWATYFTVLVVLVCMGVYGRAADESTVWFIHAPFELAGMLITPYIAWLIWQHGQNEAKKEPDREKAIAAASGFALVAGLFVALMVFIWLAAPLDEGGADQATCTQGVDC